jgi:hypothetical protein
LIKDEDIKQLTELFIEAVNRTDAIKTIAEQYRDRSMAIRIYDSKFHTGILIADGKLRSLTSLDIPTITVNIDKNTYWKVINTDNPDLQRIMLYKAFYTEQTITANTSDGDLLIHVENILKLFYEISKIV